MSHVFQIRTCSVLSLLLLVGALTGCSSGPTVHMQAIDSWKHGAGQTASEQIAKALRNSDRDDRSLVELDKAMIDLSNGRVAEAEAAFRRVHPQLEYDRQTDLTEEIESMLTDARAGAWRANDFERTLLLSNVLLASLLNDGFDTFAWSMQLEQHLEELHRPIHQTAYETDGEQTDSSPADDADPESLSGATDADTNCSSAAFASYLSGLSQSEHLSRASESRQAIQQAAAWSTESDDADTPFAPPAGLSCGPGNGAVHVIVYRDVAPQWQSVNAEPTRTALLIADRILSATNKYSLPPTITALEIAEPEERPFRLDTPCSLQAIVADSSSAPLDFHLLADLYDAAEQAALRTRDRQLAEAICRRVIKKAVIYAAKEMADVEPNSMTELGFDLLGILWEGAEEADTRAWNSLPGQILTAATELAAGEHTITFTAPDGTAHPYPLTVQSGKNTVVLVIMPEDSIISILCNRSSNLPATAATVRIDPD